MHQKLILSIFCFISFALRSQSPIIASLVKVASRVERDSASKLYVKMANIFTGVNSDSVRKYAEIANGLASENSVVKGDVLVQYGNSYHMENKVDTAVMYYEKALKYFQKIKNEKGIGKVYQSFALVKRSQGDFEGCIEDSKKAMEIYKKLNWTVGIVNTYNNIASAYGRIQKHKEAEVYGRMAFSFSKLLNDSLKYYSMMAEYGSKLIYSQRIDSGVYYLNTAAVYLERNSMYNLLIPAYSNLAAAIDLKKKSNIKIAIDAMNKAKHYTVLSGAQDNLRHVYFLLSQFYLVANEQDSAMKYFVSTISTIDSLNIAKASELTKEIETKYETEKKELQIQKQALEIEATETENKAKSTLLIISLLALVSIAAFALFAYKNYIKVKKANKVIQEQKLEVETKNTEITHQKFLVESKQKEIIDSINYAKRLQEAILPPLDLVNKYLPENFIFYKPKDIVAGDFYWAQAISSSGKTQKDQIPDLFYIAAADSTGHGVPGALVSVVCSNALNRSLKEFHITEPGKILDKTRELVIETFAQTDSSGKQSISTVQDGMDISLLCIDRKQKKVTWSGANNSLWYKLPHTGSEIENSFIEIKADKQPIGKTESLKPFTTHTLEYQENALFYLFTDGLPDQFGGPSGKKFKYKQFWELLGAVSHLTLPEQLNIVSKSFNHWKQGLEQTDDVCVIGIKI
jgi:serine phosphatase RsbU (regulator of sigma subunit)